MKMNYNEAQDLVFSSNYICVIVMKTEKVESHVHVDLALIECGFWNCRAKGITQNHQKVLSCAISYHGDGMSSHTPLAV